MDSDGNNEYGAPVDVYGPWPSASYRGATPREKQSFAVDHGDGKAFPIHDDGTPDGRF